MFILLVLVIKGFVWEKWYIIIFVYKRIVILNNGWSFYYKKLRNCLIFFNLVEGDRVGYLYCDRFILLDNYF